MTMRSIKLLAPAVAMIFTASTAPAAVLYSFSTGNKGGSDGYDASFVQTQATANVNGPTNITLADGTVGLVAFWNSEWAGFSLINDGGTEIDFGTGYLEWTVEADPGFSLNLDSLDFNSAAGGTTGTRGFELYAAVDGAAFNQATDLLIDVDDENALRASPTPRSIDLSGVTYQGISSVTFRYYPLTDTSGRTVDFDAMVLNGGIIPEPASLSLLGLGGLALLRRRRLG